MVYFMKSLIVFGSMTSIAIALMLFIFSCVVMLTDGQGALIFIFTLPITIALLVLSAVMLKKVDTNHPFLASLQLVPKIASGCLAAFFVFSFIPGLQHLSGFFLKGVETTFTYITGKTPRVFFQDRASFPTKLSEALKDHKTVSLSELDVTFAWDKFCVLGPYTDNQKAKSILGLDWNIEDHSEIHFSDSINAVVFFYEGRVNKVVDLKRGIADFKNLDTCFAREKTNFEVMSDTNGRLVLNRK